MADQSPRDAEILVDVPAGGIGLQLIDDVHRGAIVASVHDGSPLAGAVVRGDRIVGINRFDVGGLTTAEILEVFRQQRGLPKRLAFRRDASGPISGTNGRREAAATSRGLQSDAMQMKHDTEKCANRAEDIISSRMRDEAASIAPHATPTLEAGSWRLLSPPREDDEKVEVGVVELHPSLNRVAYATRAGTDQSPDIGKTRIIIHDYDTASGRNGKVLASFRLRELNKRMNEFRSLSSMVASAAHVQHSQELLHSLSTATPQSAMPYTVEMIGAVQRISFLDRDAIRCRAPKGYVREEPSRMQRLLIGFRRCAVVVSVFHTKHQPKDAYARGIQIMAYIGPDNLDEYENDEKARKRQPSSFPIPISEQILAYGCYDGGIRFYDFIRRRQAKSALGPNGRGNPVVRVIDANRTDPAGGHLRTPSCQTTLPRIVSVCATGVAYLWELDLSIDLDNGEVICFDIPPPLASFDGLVAAVSWKGVPVKYPPSLSPTSISMLSPCSSWEQTDEVNAQFEVSFDSNRNFLHWVFSPDCIGSTLVAHATHEERLDMNGALVCWDLTTLPRQEWPPPTLAPHCVMQLPRTERGRIVCDMVIPNIYGALPTSYLTSTYITSSHTLVAAVTDMSDRGQSVQLSTNATNLVDFTAMDSCGQRGFVCFVTSLSRAPPSLVCIGTQHGILFATISEAHRKQPFPLQEEAANQINKHPEAVYAQKIKDLESRNRELEHQLAEQRESARTMRTGKEAELQSRLHHLSEEQKQFRQMTESKLNATLARVKTAENELRLKTKSCQALEAKVESLNGDLGHTREELAREKQIHHDATLELASMEKKATAWEKEAEAKRALERERDNLREQLEEVERLGDRGRSEDESRLTMADYVGRDKSDIVLQEALSSAKETEESLRNYIALLEEDKSLMDKDLDKARQQAEKYAEKYEALTASLRADVREQKNAIDSLVDLLEKQKTSHEEETAGLNDEISTLKQQLSELQMKYQADVQNAKTFNEEVAYTLQAENAVLKADARTGNEVFLLMKSELEKALNELARYQQADGGKT